MRAGVIVTGVLGLGTAAVFGLAVAASIAFPQSGSIAAFSNSINNGMGGGVSMPAPIAVQMPGVVVTKDFGGGSVTVSGPVSAIESPPGK